MNGSKKVADELLSNLVKGPLDPNVGELMALPNRLICATRVRYIFVLTEVLIGVPAIYLDFVKEKAPCNIYVAAQNCFKTEKGAFTGEISPSI